MRASEGTSRFLLTGGTGFIGEHLRVALQGVPVVLFGRRTPSLRSNEQHIPADLAEFIEPDHLSGGEVLCHLAYSAAAGRKNVVYNRRLLDAVNSCTDIKRVVLISTTSVYGRVDDVLVDEESPCKPMGEYAETKLACERLWLEGLRGSCGLVVLRPSEVIGPGGRGMLTLIRDALERPSTGAIKRSLLYHRNLHYVAVGNVVQAILFCAELPLASEREIYIVSDDHQPENRSYAAMQDAVREVYGRRPLSTPALPGWALRTLGGLARRPMQLGVAYSSRKLRDAGFREHVLLREEVQRLVRAVAR